MNGRRIFPFTVDNSIVVHLTGITLRMPKDAVKRELEKYGTVYALWKKPNVFGYANAFSGSAAARVTPKEKSGLPHRLQVGEEFVDLWYVGKPKYCGFCQATGHLKRWCPNIVCLCCGEKGHIRLVCPKRSRPAPHSIKGKPSPKEQEKKKNKQAPPPSRQPASSTAQQSAPTVKKGKEAAADEEGWKVVQRRKKGEGKEAPKEPKRASKPRKNIVRQCAVVVERVPAIDEIVKAVEATAPAPIFSPGCAGAFIYKK